MPINYAVIRGSTGSTPLPIDVSSMTRRLMAVVLSALYSRLIDYQLALTILYAPGEYLPPRPEGTSFIDFAPRSWLRKLDKLFRIRPLSAVLGLGYEVDQAIGAVEYLDPSGIWHSFRLAQIRDFAGA